MPVQSHKHATHYPFLDGSCGTGRPPALYRGELNMVCCRIWRTVALPVVALFLIGCASSPQITVTNRLRHQVAVVVQLPAIVRAGYPARASRTLYTMESDTTCYPRYDSTHQIQNYDQYIYIGIQRDDLRWYISRIDPENGIRLTILEGSDGNVRVSGAKVSTERVLPSTETAGFWGSER
jgi:hypothetical protein